MFMDECLTAHMCVPCAYQVLMEARRELQIPGTEATDCSELPWGCWELNMVLL